MMQKNLGIHTICFDGYFRKKYLMDSGIISKITFCFPIQTMINAQVRFLFVS